MLKCSNFFKIYRHNNILKKLDNLVISRGQVQLVFLRMGSEGGKHPSNGLKLKDSTSTM